MIKRALRLYLEQSQRDSIDESYARGYGQKVVGAKSRRDTEFDSMLAGQAWPDDDR